MELEIERDQRGDGTLIVAQHFGFRALSEFSFAIAIFRQASDFDPCGETGAQPASGWT